MTTGKKYNKDKLFAKIDHTATSGVVGEDEYEVLGEVKLSVATDFATSGTLTVQGRILHSSSWQAVGTLAADGDFDTFDIDAYDFIRFNFTVASGTTGEIAASGFFKAASGGGGGLSFTTIQTDTGTNPVAEAASTLTVTSSDSTITVDGNSGTDTVDLTAREASATVSGIVTTGTQDIAGAKTLADNLSVGTSASKKKLGINTAPSYTLHLRGDGTDLIRTYSSGNVIKSVYGDNGYINQYVSSLNQGQGYNYNFGGNYVQAHHYLATYYRYRYVTNVGFEWTVGANKSALEVKTAGDAVLKYGITKAIDNKTGAITLDDQYHTVTCDATSAAFTVTLPAAASHSGRVYVIKKVDSSVNAVTVDGNASETIDGATTNALASQYDFIRIQCDGSNWHII